LRLTILKPVYNAGPYIGEAIGSLLNQTFEDFELWVIDEGSSDNTRQQIDLFQDSCIKKFYFDQNKGRKEEIRELIV
jgi:glycosyltransferase involved in cell wall biosynthesis